MPQPLDNALLFFKVGTFSCRVVHSDNKFEFSLQTGPKRQWKIHVCQNFNEAQVKFEQAFRRVLTRSEESGVIRQINGREEYNSGGGE